MISYFHDDMRCYSVVLALLLWLLPFASRAQLLTSARADSLYKRLNKESFEDPEGLMQPMMQLEAYYKAQKDSCCLARVLGWRGNCYDLLGQIDSSLSRIQAAQRMFQPHCDSLTLMSINTNLTSVDLSLDEYDKVIALADKRLALWNPNWPRNRSTAYTSASRHSTISAIIMALKKSRPLATPTWRQVACSFLKFA